MADIPDPPEARPIPDPTTLTTEALLREVGHAKELLRCEISALSVEVAAHHASDNDRFRKVYDQPMYIGGGFLVVLLIVVLIVVLIRR